jgi:hypothetical protein
MASDDDDELTRLVRQERVSFFAELLSFLREQRKWWLLPIAIALLLFGAFVLLSGSGVGPFIYSFF